MPSTKQAEIITFLANDVVAIPDNDAVKLARKHFGITGTVDRLASERDQNFRLKADDGREFILKITNPGEPVEITNFQTAALLHLQATAPELPVPRIFRALNGDADVSIHPVGNESPRQIMRLLSYLQGIPLYSVNNTATLRRNTATCLAKVGLALHDFHHPAATSHNLLWDTKHAASLRKLLTHIRNPEKKHLAERALNNFESHALPVLPTLRWQVVHNDLNPHNVLVDPKDHNKIAGIFDFGDMVYTPLIIDLAVAAAYNVSEHDSPLDTTAPFIAAYHATCPLTLAEVDILYDLLATRLAMVVIIGGWRAARYPENKHYILRNNATSWAKLEKLATVPRHTARQFLRSVCGLQGKDD